MRGKPIQFEIRLATGHQIILERSVMQADASLNEPGPAESPKNIAFITQAPFLLCCSFWWVGSLCLSFSIHSVELINLRPSTKSAESYGREARRRELSVVY